MTYNVIYTDINQNILVNQQFTSLVDGWNYWVVECGNYNLDPHTNDFNEGDIFNLRSYDDNGILNLYSSY